MFRAEYPFNVYTSTRSLITYISVERKHSAAGIDTTHWKVKQMSQKGGGGGGAHHAVIKNAIGDGLPTVVLGVEGLANNMEVCLLAHLL